MSYLVQCRPRTRTDLAEDLVDVLLDDLDQYPTLLNNIPRCEACYKLNGCWKGMSASRKNSVRGQAIQLAATLLYETHEASVLASMLTDIIVDRVCPDGNLFDVESEAMKSRWAALIVSWQSNPMPQLV